MRRAACILAVLAGAGGTAAPADFGISVLGGGQVLETSSGRVSQGRTTQEVTFGRTVLGGVSLDLGLGEREHLALEVAVGPYHNDIEWSCVYFDGHGCATLSPLFSTRRALLYGAHFSAAIGGRATRAVLGAGIGVKRYTFVNDPPPSYQRGPESAATLHLMAGVERAVGLHCDSRCDRWWCSGIRTCSAPSSSTGGSSSSCSSG